MPDVSPGFVTIQECRTCGAMDAGPRTLCPACHSENLIAREIEGDGMLVSWTMIRRPPASFREDGQYAVAIVRLDAGVQVTGRLDAPGDDVRPGARVKAVGRKRETTVFALA